MVRSQMHQGYGVKRIKIVLLRIRGIVKQGLGYLLITLSSSHFFNKTDIELYLSLVFLSSANWVTSFSLTKLLGLIRKQLE